MKSQFQNLVLQQTLQDHARQLVPVQPSLTLPIKPEELMPLPDARITFPTRPGMETFTQNLSEARLFAPNGRTEMDTPSLSGPLLQPTGPLPAERRKKHFLRGLAILLSALLMLAIGLTWRAATPTSASPTISTTAGEPGPQATSNLQPTATSTEGATIQVYIVGAIKHPGVYTLPADARVYQLLKAAGGTLPDANLVSVNLAARLSDGEEIYVLAIGETPPTYSASQTGSGSSNTPTTNGQLVNINTATESEMVQELHVSSTTANKIITYRTQHGPYTSVDQLLQAISQSIYDRIKDMVTV